MTINNNVSGLYQGYSNSSVQSRSGASSQVSASDYTQAMQDALGNLISSIDTNKDGTIDPSELSQAAQNLSDKTGKSYDTQAAFQALDTNANGSLSSDELMNALMQMHGKGGHHRRHEQASAEQSNSSGASAQSASADNKMQSALLQRILAAYGTNATPQSTSSITV